MRDARGLEVPGASAEAVEAVERFRDRMLSLGTGPEQVLTDADEHPSCALLQIDAAVLHLYGFTDADDAAAERFLARARALSPSSERERAWLDATRAWLARDYEAALSRLEDVTRRWPRDLLAAKVAEFHYYATGQHWQAARFLAHMERLAEHNSDSSHFLAMLAFALELSGRWDEARATAERAIEMERCTPWAHHCLGHVHLRRGEIERGEAVLRDLAPTWSASGQPIRGHNAWHLALFGLARLDFDETLRLYHRDVSGALPDAVGEQVDAVSLLWRVELAGRTLDDEWSRLADRIEPRAAQCFIPFVSAHDVYALARAGRREAVRASLDACRRAADLRSGERRRVWAEVGLPLVEASAAFAEGDSVKCGVLLEPVIDRIGCVGGSDAQDDLFRQTHLVSLLRAKRRASARTWLDAMLDGREATPLEQTWAAAL